MALEILFIDIKNPRKFLSISRTFISAQKQHHGSSIEKSETGVCFIQIMQIRVQNKRKSVRKIRYVGEVSIIHILKRASVTGTVRVLSSTKDKAPLSMPETENGLL